MKTSLFLLALVAGIPVTLLLARPEGEHPKDDAAAATPSRAELEERFRETLSRATLDGHWRLVKDGAIGEEREERYTLGEVRHVGGDSWTIEARIQYGEKDVRLPVPVKVLWAGDTPVITVTELWLPGLGKYTARVMVYRDLYTGTWFGAGYGGVMSGRVVKAGEGKEERKEP